MAEVQIVTIRQQVYQILREEILNGSLQEGQWLQELEISRRLGVSRSPVREALRELSADGLVSEIPNKGVFVRTFTTKDIEEVFEVRVLLENHAIESLYRLSDNDRMRLEETIKELRSAYEDGDRRLYIRKDSELHKLFISLSGNELLHSMYERVDCVIQRFRIYSLEEEKRFSDSLDEHERIVSYILEGRLLEATQVNREHLRLARDGILAHIKNM